MLQQKVFQLSSDASLFPLLLYTLFFCILCFSLVFLLPPTASSKDGTTNCFITSVFNLEVSSSAGFQNRCQTKCKAIIVFKKKHLKACAESLMIDPHCSIILKKGFLTFITIQAG